MRVQLSIGARLRWMAVLLLACTAAPGTAGSLTTRPAALKPTEVTDRCVNESCHANIVGRKVPHGPAVQQKCLACHQSIDAREHRFKLAAEGSQLCRDCHVLPQRTVVHAPVKQGNCTGCHDPHGSDFRAMLLSDPTRGLCLNCHKQEFAKRKFVHGPVSVGACILCHEAHSAWEPKLLTDKPQRLCAGCHSEMAPSVAQARHVHAPVRDGNCTGCHDAHASDLKYQLRDSAPGLCLSCHKEMAKTVAASHVTHGAVREGAACSACHTPHFSELPKLQRLAQPQSCLGCHNKQMKSDDGKTLANLALLLKENPQQHGPIREGACSACHQPHAGQNFRLLAAKYPPDFYAPFEMERYALCFNCHIQDLVLKQNGTGVTRFRNGDVNLHWLHVNREKGRTCRACHEVHASRNPFHIRDAVPFGAKGWMLEINYKQTATGGGCSPGCHKSQTYDREASPPAPAPSMENTIHASLPTKTSLAR